MALVMAEVAITLGVDLAVKALINRYIRNGMDTGQIMQKVMKRMDILETAHLVSNRDLLILHGKLDDVVAEVQKTQVRAWQEVLLIGEFLDLDQKLWPWTNILLVLFNGMRAQKFENAKLLLFTYDEEDHDDLILAGMTFTKTDVLDVNRYMREISNFAKKAARTKDFRLDIEIAPNEDPNGRNSKLCSVVFEMVVTGWESEESRNMTYMLGEEVILPGPTDGRRLTIIIDESSGFVDEMNNIQERFSMTADTDKAYTEAEEEYRERLKRIEETNDVYFLGLTGEGKSSLINALLGTRATRTRDIGVGTTRIEQFGLIHRNRLLRFWDLPGGDDENNMDEYNIEKLRCHLRSEQQVAQVILVNQRGRNLRKSEQNCLLLYKDIFGAQLEKIITVVIGRDERDCIDGVKIKTSKMQIHMVNQLENLGIEITKEQVLFIRPVAVGSERGPPPGLEKKLDMLKDHLASRKPVFTGFAYWMYTKLLEITNLRESAEKSRLLKELHRENEKYIQDFIAGVNVNRRAKLVRKHDGLVLTYSDFDARAWIKREEIRHRVDITGDNYGTVERIHSSYGRRRLGAVRIKAQLFRIFKELRSVEVATENQLILIRTSGKTLPSDRGSVIWKEYRVVDPMTGLSDYTDKRVREIVDEIMKGRGGIREESRDTISQRHEPIM